MPEPFLDYAPGQSLVTRIGRRRLIWITILVAIALAAFIWADAAIRRWRSSIWGWERSRALIVNCGWWIVVKTTC